MYIAETLSVNPVSKTLGALHPEAAVRMMNTGASASLRHERKSKSTFSKLFFGRTNPSATKFGGYMLLFRAMFATLLSVSGALTLSGNIAPALADIPAFYIGLGEIIVAGLILLGFFTRITAIIPMLFFGYISYLAISTGVFDMQSLMLTMVSVALLTTGAGLYSCDFLMHKAIVMHRRRRLKKIKEQRLSYRAFSLQN